MFIPSFVLMLLSCVPAAAIEAGGKSTVTVRTETDKKSLHIGDRVRYTIEVRAPKEVEVEFPDFGENLAEFGIRDFGSSTGGFFGTRTLTRWYVLDIYETGTFTIPGAVIRYRYGEKDRWKEKQTEPVDVEVLSVLDSYDERTDIRDIKGPVSLFNYAYLYIAIAIIAVIAIFVVTSVYLKKKKPAEKEAEPPRPAHEIAYEALKELMSRDYLRTGQVQEHYFGISDIVRRYIENRFQLRAPEMTTEEFLLSVKDAEVLNAEQKTAVKAFLSHCDMVKFAKYIPDGKENESSYLSAKTFIDQTREPHNAGGAKPGRSTEGSHRMSGKG